MPEISLSPGKRLFIDGDNLDQYPTQTEAFQRGSGHGLLYLDIAAGLFAEQESFVYWKDFARRYLSLFAAAPNLEQRDLSNDPITIPIPEDELYRREATAKKRIF